MTLADPYRPGRSPHVLAGRDAELRTIREKIGAMATYRESGGPLTAFHGPRGLGKTSLLIEAQRQARDAGLLTAWVEGTASAAGSNLVAAIAADLKRETVDLAPSDTVFAHRLDKLSVEFGVPGARLGAELHRPDTPEPEMPATIRDLLEDSASLATNHDLQGLVLFVDEFQAAGKHERAALLAAMQAFDRTNVPVAIIVAGLPNTPAAVVEAATYGERTDFRRLGWLDKDAVRAAVTTPAHALGVTWSPQALDQVVTFTQGYPHAIQLLGAETWQIADPDQGDTIDHSHVAQGQAAAERRLTELYTSRIQRLSPLETQFVTAMASLNLTHTPRAAIAKAMGRESDSIGVVRQTLLDKGFVYEASYGHLAFTVPGIDNHIRTHAT